MQRARKSVHFDRFIIHMHIALCTYRLQKLEKKKFYQNRSLPLSDVHGLQAVPHRCNQRLDDLLTGTI